MLISFSEKEDLIFGNVASIVGNKFFLSISNYMEATFPKMRSSFSKNGTPKKWDGGSTFYYYGIPILGMWTAAGR